MTLVKCNHCKKETTNDTGECKWCSKELDKNLEDTSYKFEEITSAKEKWTKEMKLERALELKNKEIQKLKAQRDTTDEYASNMQQRSNKAIHDRDESNYALKQALVEVEKYKSRLKIAESLIGSGRPKENNKKSLITPITVGMTTILVIVLFGRRFS